MVESFSIGAGSCNAGMAAVGGNHLDPTKMTSNTSSFIDMNISFNLNGISLTPSQRPQLFEDSTYTIEVIAGNSNMKGCLIRFGQEGISNYSTNEIITVIPITNTQIATVCNPGTNAVGVTHMNSISKSICSCTMNVNISIPITIDVTVVIENTPTSSIYGYEQYIGKYTTLSPTISKPTISNIPSISPLYQPSLTSLPTKTGTIKLDGSTLRPSSLPTSTGTIKLNGIPTITPITVINPSGILPTTPTNSIMIPTSSPSGQPTILGGGSSPIIPLSPVISATSSPIASSTPSSSMSPSLVGGGSSPMISSSSSPAILSSSDNPPIGLTPPSSSNGGLSPTITMPSESVSPTPMLSDAASDQQSDINTPGGDGGGNNGDKKNDIWTVVSGPTTPTIPITPTIPQPTPVMMTPPTSTSSTAAYSIMYDWSMWVLQSQSILLLLLC